MMLLLIALLQVAPPITPDSAVACVETKPLTAGESAKCSGWLVSPLRIRELMRQRDECKVDLEAAVEREDARKSHEEAVRAALSPALAGAIVEARASLRRTLHLSTARPKRAFYDRPWVWGLLGAAVGVGGYKFYRWVRE